MDLFSKILATVAITGFAIQQLLEILKPWINAILIKACGGDPNKQPLQGLVSYADLKKWIMAMLAFIFGIITVLLTELSLLTFIDPQWKGNIGDVLVSALVIGAGTEGLNTLTKYFGYIKDGRKANIQPAVSLNIMPTNTTVKTGNQFHFQAVSQGNVEWYVAHSNGGTIDINGVYTAPNQTGSFQVIAKSTTDPTKQALASINVIQ